jgi:hypothetical protein
MKKLIDKINKEMLKIKMDSTIPDNPIYKLQLSTDKIYCTYPEYCAYQKLERNGYINLCMEGKK